MAAAARQRPNILISGTPGTGKTTTAELLASATGFRHINVGELVKQEELHSGWDDEYECYVLDEDKVVDALEDALAAGGCIVDYHGCDFFPERWFDLVLVLQADTSVLWERLERRGYAAKKVQENVQCEIMHVIVEEAREAYAEEIVHAVASNTAEEMERNVDNAHKWAAAWKPAA